MARRKLKRARVANEPGASTARNNIKPLLPHPLSAGRAHVRVIEGGPEVGRLDARIDCVSLDSARHGRARQPGQLGPGPPFRGFRQAAPQAAEGGIGVAAAAAAAENETAALCHGAGVDGEDLLAPFAVGRADEELELEAAGPHERRVDEVKAVGKADDDLPRRVSYSLYY